MNSSLSSLKNTFTGNLGNTWNQILDFIVKIIRDDRVCRTTKEKVNFVY